jgi:hypothetical protein
MSRKYGGVGSHRLPKAQTVLRRTYIAARTLLHRRGLLAVVHSAPGRWRWSPSTHPPFCCWPPACAGGPNCRRPRATVAAADWSADRRSLLADGRRPTDAGSPSGTGTFGKPHSSWLAGTCAVNHQLCSPDRSADDHAEIPGLRAGHCRGTDACVGDTGRGGWPELALVSQLSLMTSQPIEPKRNRRLDLPVEDLLRRARPSRRTRRWLSTISPRTKARPFSPHSAGERPRGQGAIRRNWRAARRLALEQRIGEPRSSTPVQSWRALPVTSGFRWRRWDLNPRPPACKAGALPTELRPRGCSGYSVRRVDSVARLAISRFLWSSGRRHGGRNKRDICSNVGERLGVGPIRRKQ